MRTRYSLTVLFLVACGTTPAAQPAMACTPQCTLQVRNIDPATLHLSAGGSLDRQAIGTVDPHQVREFTLETMPSTFIAVFRRDSQSVIGTCRSRGGQGQLRIIECSAL